MVLFREGPVHDPAEMQEYARKGRENPPDPKLIPLAIYGAITPLEGEPPDGVVILQFPTVEDARSWYFGPAYQDASPHRRRAAEYRAVIVKGL